MKTVNGGSGIDFELSSSHDVRILLAGGFPYCEFFPRELKPDASLDAAVADGGYPEYVPVLSMEDTEGRVVMEILRAEVD